MVHQFFQKVATNSGLANHHACLAIRNSHGKLPFSEIFPIFFLNDDYVPQDRGLDSWLDAISTSFEFNLVNVSSRIISEVTSLFNALRVSDPRSPSNARTFQFWIYLFFLYEKLIGENCGGDGNFFAFLRVVPANSTKMVIWSTVPLNDGASTGYAFHGNKCESTRQMLDFVEKDTRLVSSYMSDPFLKISETELNTSKQTFNLHGWIKQEVLLLNSCLSHHQSGPIFNAWQVFINFVIRYLSNSIKGVAFILMGEEIHHKQQLINVENNYVISVCHPEQYAQEPPQQIEFTQDWRYFPPFHTSNFYLYKVHGMSGLIDWKSTDSLKNGVDYRITQMARFCDNIRDWNRYCAATGQMLVIGTGIYF